MPAQIDAVVVGAGPNGLAAAITLARAGRSVVVYEAAAEPGGGTRSGPLTEPGHVHDLCAAVHAFGPVSPLLRSLPLAEYGLEWVHPEVALAHPLPDRPAVVLHRNLAATVEHLGPDGGRYEQLVGPLVNAFDDLAEDLLAPVARIPRHPVTLARFGLAGMLPATALARWLGRGAGSLAAGCAAHSFLSLRRPFTSSFALALLASAHAGGWPFVRGGSQRLADAMVSYLHALGGEVHTNRPVRSLADLPPARAVLFDVAPGALADIAGDRLSALHRRRLRRFRAGPGAFKVDYALTAPVPWSDPAGTQAGTLHLGGDTESIARAEAEVVAGGHPPRPFVLVAQPSRFDEHRAPPGSHTLWAYCHVPNGSTRDMSAAIDAQIERFAPGFGEIVRSRHIMAPHALQAHNANYRGGDIAGGAHDGMQLVFRPVIGRPYRTSDPHLLLCSASTPPGAGVHGMCGFNAARAALAGPLR